MEYFAAQKKKGNPNYLYDFIKKKNTALEIMDRKFKQEVERFRALKKGTVKYE